MIDLDKLRTLYKFGKNLNLTDAQELLKSAKRKSYAISDYLVEEGTIRKEIFFIRKGLVRTFVINEKGDEITTQLRWENQIIASPDVILFDQPSRLYFEALEPTDVFLIDYNVLQSIVSNNPKLEANRKYVFQNLLKELFQRVESFVLLNPEERYTRFVASYPGIVNRVPNKYIANVLGITPVSLSRIRKRIAEKKK